jgi:hypothetical protein
MVWIEAYYRLRYGKIEYVKGHWRSPSAFHKSAASAPLANPPNA